MAAGAQAAGPKLQVVDGRFVDCRWTGGRWDLTQFAGKDGSTDWDAVIDAEMARRKLLEDNPLACSERGGGGGRGRPPPPPPSPGYAPPPPPPPQTALSGDTDPVLFDTAEIPWWAWIRRFHLPEVCGMCARGGGAGLRPLGSAPHHRQCARSCCDCNAGGEAER